MTDNFDTEYSVAQLIISYKNLLISGQIQPNQLNYYYLHKIHC